MKLILNVDDMVDYSPAMSAAMLVMQQHPTQQEGTAISVSERGKKFSVVRNADSYTVSYA